MPPLYWALLLCWAVVGILSLDYRLNKIKILLFIGTAAFIGYKFFPMDKAHLINLAKLLGIVVFYCLLGWWPAKKWVPNHYCITISVILAVILGNIFLNVLSLSLFWVLGPKTGSIISLALAVLVALMGVYFSRGATVDFKLKGIDWQIMAVIALGVSVNIIKMQNEYPHGHPEMYVNYTEQMLQGVFPPKSMATIHTGLPVAHFAAITVVALWVQTLNAILHPTMYFEVVIAFAGFMGILYLFVRKWFVDEHVFGIAAMIFIALLGTLQLYVVFIKLLLGGHNIDIVLAKSNASTSIFQGNLWGQLSPQPIPFALISYIDQVKSYALGLLSLMLVLNGGMSRLPMVFAGTAIMIVAGNAAEEVMVAYLSAIFLVLIARENGLLSFIIPHKYLLAILFFGSVIMMLIGAGVAVPVYVLAISLILLEKDKGLRQIAMANKYFLLGLFLGAIVWFYNSIHSGALLVVKEGGILTFRPWREFGLRYADYEDNFSEPLLIKGLGFSSIIVLLKFIGLPCVLATGLKKIWKELIMREQVFYAIPIGLAGIIFFPLFTPMGDTGRMLNPFVFWLYLLAGLGFAAYFRKKDGIKGLGLAILIMTLSILPTLRWVHQFALVSFANLPFNLFSTGPYGGVFDYFGVCQSEPLLRMCK